MAGAGLDAHVIAGVSLRLKRVSGKLAYAAETARQILRYSPREYVVIIDGIAHRAASVIVANSRFYGGGLSAHPSLPLRTGPARLPLPTSGRWNAARYAAALVSGRLARLPDYTVLRAVALTLAGPPGDPLQLDGDIGSRLPAEIHVAKARLNLLCPAG